MRDKTVNKKQLCDFISAEMKDIFLEYSQTAYLNIKKVNDKYKI
jgi:hypothetical protein